MVAVVQLLGCHFQHVVELGKELSNALLLILNAHTFDGQLHDVDGRKTEVAASDAGLRAKTVLEDASATAHRGHLMQIALRVVGAPVSILVERGVEVQEVGEESSGRHLASQLVEVEVAVFGQVVHATLLLPYLNGEDSRLTIAYAFVGGEQNLAHNATSFRARVRTIINRREDHLVATT